MKEYFDKIAADAFKDELSKIIPGIEKKAGIGSELGGMVLNPLNMIANLPAGIVAAITPTLTKEKMAKSQDADISNILIPGMGAYRYWKRLGVGNKEMKRALAEKIIAEGAAE